MKASVKLFLVLLMFLFAVLPFLVIYDPLSKAVPFLPNYESPSWFVPAGFVSILGIVILAIMLGNGDKHEPF
ncbi:MULTISPECIES: hypothetical protein [Shouchella]|uniref:Uncharacterized protein n=3 Tax=Bacillaceae TaxID=186817 RepID=A0A060LZA3_9BACI|nr:MULTISPECIES: hypothetical protein [Shouchella]AIC93139.1 hypothetical protein BleG1_0531 [Shouchella lehensis G1]KQL58560.1 hypothetical protein AN965_03070 [Alkalicoccobacillus plakortidis]MBG9783069.1 hypothetical protein [Shouchella lehensis]TES49571.1 hypothetical protein E2L03_08890 [Shouchella lehensis]